MAAAAGAAAQPCWTVRLLVRLRGPHFPLPFGEPFSSGFAGARRAGRWWERETETVPGLASAARCVQDLGPSAQLREGGFFALRPVVFLFETGPALHNCFVWGSHRYRDPKTGGALRNKAQPPFSIRRFLPVSEVEREPCFLVGEERVGNTSRLLLTPSRFCLRSAGNRLG